MRTRNTRETPLGRPAGQPFATLVRENLEPAPVLTATRCCTKWLLVRSRDLRGCALARGFTQRLREEAKAHRNQPEAAAAS